MSICSSTTCWKGSSFSTELLLNLWKLYVHFCLDLFCIFLNALFSVNYCSYHYLKIRCLLSEHLAICLLSFCYFGSIMFREDTLYDLNSLRIFDICFMTQYGLSDFFFSSKCNVNLMTAHWWYPVYFLCRGEEMLVYRKKLNVILSNLLLKMSTTI